MNTLLDDLNERQHEAVISTEGFVRLVAGAGSGKTKALTHRYAFIVKALGVPPGNVLCVTFSNKAAAEMRNRIRALIGDGYDTSLITTYHGFCVRVLRESISKLFYPENFIILDVSDQKKILEEIYEFLEIRLDSSTFEKMILKIDTYKRSPLYVLELTDTEKSIDIKNAKNLDEKIIKMYLQRQRKVFGLDFNDLINFTFVIFEKYRDVKELWQQRLFYIQVDEFQDSSQRELNLVDILSQKSKNLFVVGDPDQNIYEWRGAKVELLVDFDKTHHNTQTVIMDQNYRSTPQILAVANSLIDKNVMRIKKELKSVKENSDKPIFFHAKTEHDEIMWVCNKIKNLVKDNVYSYKDITILYRSNYLSRFIENGLVNEGIPYTIWGGIKFFDRMEIKDSLSYLRMLTMKDDIAFSRVINVPKRRFGKGSMQYLKEMAAKENASLYDTLKMAVQEGYFERTGAKEFINTIELITEEYNNREDNKLTLSQIFNNLLDKSGYEKYMRQNGDMERLDNLAELKKNITDFERLYENDASIETYLQQAAIQADKADGEELEKVRLMTIHTSKGLEFPCVFVCGLTDGVFPSARTIEDRKQTGLEEERRLMFVAITRAEDFLFLTDSEGFSNNGGRKFPSRFLFDINKDYLEIIGKLPNDIPHVKNMSQIQSPISLFAEGDELLHPFFGKGVVKSIDKNKQVYDIYFEKMGQIRPISFEYQWKQQNENFEKLNNDEENEIIKNLPIFTKQIKDEAVKPIAKKDDLVIYEKINENEIEYKEVKREEFVIILPEEKPYEKHEKSEFEESESEQLTFLPTVKEPNDVIPLSDINMNFENDVLTEESTKKEEKEKIKKEKPKNKKPEISNNHWDDPNFPKKDWYCEGISDLGKPVAICGMCNKQNIRYVHHMYHPSGLQLKTGCVCAGKLEGDEAKAIERENSYKLKLSRKKTFLKKEWKISAKQNLYIKYKGEIVALYPDKFNSGFWSIVAKGRFINKISSKEEAKLAAFELLDE